MAQRGRIELRSELPKQQRTGDSFGSGPPSGGEPPLEIPEWLEEVRLTVEKEAPLLRTLLVRGIKAVLQFTALSESAIANATEAPTDLVVLLRALSSPDLLEDLRQAEPLAPAFIRGIEASRRLINEHGGALTAAQAAEILSISRQMVEKRRRAGKLLAISTGRHGYRYPAWQFHKSGILLGLEDVLEVLANHDSWMQVAFFVSKNDRLAGDTPIEALKAGKLEPVLNAAAAYGEHGAE
jgi:hypothetical protein